MIAKILLKHNFLKNKNFIAICKWKILLIPINAKNVCKDFEIKNLGEYQDYFLKIDTVILVDVFESFREMSLKIYHLNSTKIFSAPGVAWQAALQKTEVKLELLTDTAILLMVEKGIRGGIFHSIYRYAKANDKYMKDYDENKESSYIKYWDVNNLYGWAMSQKLPVEKNWMGGR